LTALEFVILIALCMSLSAVLVHVVHGFEMTPQLKIETAQLEMCIMYNINNTTCENIYGGIGH